MYVACRGVFVVGDKVVVVMTCEVVAGTEGSMTGGAGVVVVGVVGAGVIGMLVPTMSK